MNNKGFTLIELIMTIAILSMLMVFVAPNVVKLINKNKVDNYNSTLDSIIETSEIYVSNNRYDMNFYKNENYDEKVFCVPGDTNVIYSKLLLKDLDLDFPIKNHCNDENISQSTVIKVELNCKTKQFKYTILFNGDTNLIKKESVTDDNGRILDRKTCSDLY